MSEQIYQIAWLLANRMPTHVPAMKCSQLGELLWWVDYFCDSDEDIYRKSKKKD